MIKRFTSFFQLFLILIILFGSCEPIKISPWDVLESNTVLVFESKRPPIFPNALYKHFFPGKTNVYLSAVQKSSKDGFDIIYSFAISKKSYDSILSIKSFSGNHKITDRKSNGYDIHELINERNEIQAAFTYIQGVFVLSRSSILVENAVRVFQHSEQRNFKINNSVLFHFPSLKSDQGDVYINTSRISELFSDESSLLESIPLLKEFKNQAVYDVKSSDEFLSLNGFSLGGSSGIALFQKQKPVALKMAKYVPNYANSLVHFGASDFHSLSNHIDSSFLKAFDIGNEIAFVGIEKSSKRIIAFVEFKSGSLEDFDFIAPYTEIYSNYQIRSVNGDLLKKRFGTIFPDDPFSFCTIKDNYLLLAPTVRELKSVIDAIEVEDTWGKTLEFQKFSEKGLQESNFTLIIKKPEFFSTNTRLIGYSNLIDSLGLSKIKWCSFQLSALDNHFYSNINLSLGSSVAKPETENRNSKSSIIELPGVVEFASLVKNHNSGVQEIIVQDSNFWIYLLSPKGEIIWKRQIDGPIKGSLVQIDYYKNSKLQYYFYSGSKLYIIDRLGRDVSGFPKSLPTTISYSVVVDYDKTKNYRFLNSLSDFSVYLLDKTGDNLNEWGPKKFNSETAYAPEHFKIGGKDHFMVVFVDGAVQVFNRRGEKTNAFQWVNKENSGSDYYIEPSMSSSETYLYYISKEGSLVKQNLKGEVISTDNLIRGINSKFILKRIINRDGFYIYRVDTDKLVVFDRQRNMVFEKQNTGSLNVDIQGVARGNNKVVFSFRDLEQKFVQVYDESGNSLIQIPIESNLAPLFVFGKPGIYSFTGNTITFNPIQ